MAGQLKLAKWTMNIIISGGTGYIGSSLIPKLIEEYKVVYNIGRSEITKISSGGIVETIDYTINSLVDVLEQLSPDLYLNLSAGYYTNNSSHDLNVIDGNLKIQLIVLEFFKLQGRGRFINIGSYWEFSYSRKNVKGVNPYGIIKSALRSLLKYYATYNVHYTNLMLYGTYGENDHRGKIIDCIIHSANSEQFLKLSPGEQKLNLVYINDIVSAILIIVSSNEKKYHNKTFSIHTEKEYKIKDIVELINEIKHNNLLIGELPYRDDEVMAPEYKYENIINVSDKVKEYIIEKVKNDTD